MRFWKRGKKREEEKNPLKTWPLRNQQKNKNITTILDKRRRWKKKEVYFKFLSRLKTI